MKPDLKTLAGAPVEQQRFSFTTGGPAVIEQMPWRYGQIDEEQVFILGLDAPVREHTVVEHAWCDASGIAEKIGVRVVTGEERRQILDSRADFLDRWPRGAKEAVAKWQATLAEISDQIERRNRRLENPYTAMSPVNTFNSIWS